MKAIASRMIADWSNLDWRVRAPVLAGLTLVAIVVPVLALPSGWEGVRWLAYAINAVMIVMVARTAWVMRRAIGDFEAGISFAAAQRGMKSEAALAESVHQTYGNLSTGRTLWLSILTSLGCVFLISILVASLFYGLAFYSHAYDPISIAEHDYLTFLAYVVDKASLRGFFGFLDLFENFDLLRGLGWHHAFPERLTLNKSFALGASLAALRLYSQIVAVGLLFVIVRILVLRKKYKYLFVPEQRMQVIQA